MTTYDDYDTYQVGDSWDYNSEMSELFEKKFERGPVSNRPSASNSPDNAIWLATDQNLLYENDPTNGWTVTGHGDSNNPVPEGNFQSVSTDESVTVSGDDTIAYGRSHGNTVQGDNVVIGVGAEALADDDGTLPGNDPRQVSIGFRAGEGGTGFGVVAAGYRAALNNTGNRVVAAGYQAALDNTGDNSTFVGDLAGFGGSLSDPTTMGSDNIGIGLQAMRDNQASGVIAIGQEAGYNVQTDDLLIVTDRGGNRRYKGFLKNKTDENASDFETLGAGAGLIVTSSDGSERRRITIDNSGGLVAETV